MRASKEQMEPENGPLPGIITTVLLFICIITIASYSYMKSLNPSAGFNDLLKFIQGAGDKTAKQAEVMGSFEIEADENPLFVLYDDYIAEAKSGGVWFLDRKGEVSWLEPVILNGPIIKNAGSKLLAAGTGSGEICVFSGKSVVWKDKLGEQILNADINEDGYVTVITSAKRDNNEIRVYDPHGVELIRKIIANDFAVSAGISPSGKILAVSVISAGAAAAYSNYKFYDTEGKELAKTTFDASGEMLPLFWFTRGGGIFAAGDRALALIDNKGKLTWEKDYISVAGAAPYGTGSVAAAVENADGYRLAIYSADGRELSSEKLKEKPSGINAVRGIIAAYTNDTALFFNDRCENTVKFKADSIIRQVYFFNRYQAVIITDNQATVININ